MSRRRPEPPADRSGEAADPESVVRNILLRKLSAAPRTRSELEKDLARRGADPAVAATVLDRFEDVGLIDDESFAAMWVESRHRSKALARSVLRQELRHRGVDAETIDSAVGQIDDDDEWIRARDFARRKVRVKPGEDPRKALQRLAGQLARKGYPGNVCFAVARDALGVALEQWDENRIDEPGAGIFVDDLAVDQESV